METDTKRCSRCLKNKPLEEFYRHRSKPLGRCCACIVCTRTKRMPLTKEERFWLKVEKTPSCWIWTATLNHCGYGRFNAGKGKLELAHRYSWKIAHGPIPRGLYCLHHCDNPACVNPKHLFLGTQTCNMKDMVRKGRSNKRLSESEVRQIRDLCSRKELTQKKISKRFGVSQSAVSLIHNRKNWSHL